MRDRGRIFDHIDLKARQPEANGSQIHGLVLTLYNNIDLISVILATFAAWEADI